MTADGHEDDRQNTNDQEPGAAVDQLVVDRLGRLLALQALYELDLTSHTPDEAIANAFENQERDLAVVALFAAAEPRMDDVDANVRRLVNGVLGNVAAIDPVIESAAPARALTEQAAIERNVLRLAAYELMFEPQVPAGSLINDSVELAKGFGGENSGKFINGVLGTVFKQVQRQKTRKKASAAQGGKKKTGSAGSANA
ncbi:MAG: transcription antitermination factor NusB [Thermomicrobiales bacterium]